MLDVDDLPPLGDLDFPGDHEVSGGRAGRGHEGTEGAAGDHPRGV